MSYLLTVVYLGLILSKRIDLTIFLMSINGFISGLCATIYVYAASFVSKRKVGTLSTFFMAYDGLTTFTQAFYYRFVSQNYTYYFYFVVIESVIIVIVGHLCLLENENTQKSKVSNQNAE
jgi:hypothetical protein